jgi:hypothetical protein
MISNEDKHTIKEIGQRYNVSKVYLLRSGASSGKDAVDIHLAVAGMPDSGFFKFRGNLVFALLKPVDLTDLNKKSMFSEMIMKEGILLYG